MVSDGTALPARPFHLKLGLESRLKYPACATAFLVFLSASTWAWVITTDFLRLNRYGWI